jgi:hypothetical protein
MKANVVTEAVHPFIIILRIRSYNNSMSLAIVARGVNPLTQRSLLTEAVQVVALFSKELATSCDCRTRG